MKSILTNWTLATSLIIFYAATLWACNPEDFTEPDVNIQETKNVTSIDSINQKENSKTMKIKISVGEMSVIASMLDNATARDFISLLPLTLTLDDYAGTEKISYLSRKLSTQGAPSGTDPDIGDITYYAPWGNLAIFYKDFSYSGGLVKLGQIEGEISILKTSQRLIATFELVE
jgi:hypothetical protein